MGRYPRASWVTMRGLARVEGEKRLVVLTVHRLRKGQITHRVGGLAVQVLQVSGHRGEQRAMA